MAGRGPAPNKYAKRQKRGGQRWTVVQSGDAEWTEFLDSGQPMELPDAVGWGPRTVALWDEVWLGPMRGDMIPAYVESLRVMCDWHHRMVTIGEEKPGSPAEKAASQEFRSYAREFAISPLGAAAQRKDVKPTRPTTADRSPEKSAEEKPNAPKFRLAPKAG